MPGSFVSPAQLPATAEPQGLHYSPTDAGGGANAIDLILSVVALAHPGPGADLHRHRDPAVGRPPRGAVRGDAPGRRDPQAGLR